MSPIPALVLLSGGIDSIACAHFLKVQGHSVEGIFMDYGQAPARRERPAAKALAKHLQIPLTCISAKGPVNLGAGEVPGRNAFLILSAMVLRPWTSGIVALGIHAGNSYYDCSEAFLARMSSVVAEHTDGRLALVAPFIQWGKKEVFDYFSSASLPIGLTYSCEASAGKPCGTCDSCRDRKTLGC